MFATIVPLLGDLLNAYYDDGEFFDLANLFGVEFTEGEFTSSIRQLWFDRARQLIANLNRGNYRAFLDVLLDQMERRSLSAIATTTFERRYANEQLRDDLAKLRSTLAESPTPSEITTPENTPFTSKSEVRELLSTATTDVLIVDPYVGVGTLDCLRDVTTSIRLLTAAMPQAIEGGFASSLSDFRKEGFQINVRRVAMQHDRHLVFNDRCWLVGSSLKDAGKKAFHCIEIVDDKAEVVGRLEAKWASGTPL